MAICDDCNHALFSRMYGVQGVDVIINSTGGEVVYDKWYKYNQVRAIENPCYMFVTMGGFGSAKKVKNYVYGFNPNGKELQPELLNGDSEDNNVPGGIYLYDTAMECGGAEPEPSLHQNPTVNRHRHFFVPVGRIGSVLQTAKKLEDGLYVYPFEKFNIVFCIADGGCELAHKKYNPLRPAVSRRLWPAWSAGDRRADLTSPPAVVSLFYWWMIPPPSEYTISD